MNFFVKKSVLSVPDGRYICYFDYHDEDDLVKTTIFIGKLEFTTYLVFYNNSDIRALAQIGIDANKLYSVFPIESDIEALLFCSVYPLLAENVHNARISNETIEDESYRAFFAHYSSKEFISESIPLNYKISKFMDVSDLKDLSLGIIKYALDLILEMKFVKTNVLDSDDIFTDELVDSFQLVLDAKEIFDKHDSFIELQNVKYNVCFSK